MRHLVKLGLELGPLLIFFIANARFGILTGTACFVAATLAALAASYAMTRKIPIMPLIAGVFVVIFGGLTVALANDLFIKIKPTIVNLCFAAILAFGLATGRLYIKLLLDTAVHLADRGWVILTRAWIGFFILLAALNEIVWRSVPTDTWVKFKVFGILPLTLVFSVALIPLIAKYVVPDDSTSGAEQ